jgi:hypothetical protein
MPIPALSKSYKQRLQVDRGNQDAGVVQVTAARCNIGSIVFDLLQSMEALRHDEEATNVNGPGSNLRPLHIRTSSYQSDADGSRRRSFLPQPGQTRYSSQQDSAAPKMDNTNVQPPAPGRLRPRSMYQHPSTQAAQPRSEEQTALLRSMRPPNAISKPAEPQTTGLSRSRSLRKPGTTTQTGQTAPSSTHARAQSSITSGLRKEVSNVESSAARPRSLLAAPRGHTKSNSMSAESAPVASRTSARLAGLSRTASAKMKPDSANSSVATQPVPRADDPVGAQPRHRGIPKEEPTRSARPAFSTLQQHFTPRKVAKAPTSTFLHPAPTSGDNSLPPEILSLQSELLQLHLLHANSVEVSQQWNASARRTLHKKFDEVTSLHQAMLEYERAGQEQKNLQALLEWSTGTSHLGLIEYMQILSGPLHELPSLVEPGGRAERLTNEFEGWVSRVEHLWSARHSATIKNGDIESVDGLGDAWKAENAALTRKVTSFTRDLDQVHQPTSGSSIASLVETCRELLRGLADELYIMHIIEAGVVEKEKEWVEARLQAIARDVGTYSVDMEEETAAWRA